MTTLFRSYLLTPLHVHTAALENQFFKTNNCGLVPVDSLVDTRAHFTIYTIIKNRKKKSEKQQKAF